jgi:branched-chain amino acid transport system ATP-binding protein
MLEVDGLSSAYGRIIALREVGLTIAEGEIVALVGSNGAGKTTLLKAIAGVQPVTAGRICFDGRDITALPAHARVAAGLVLVPEGRQVFRPLSVADNLRLGAYRRGGGGAAETARDLDRVYAMFPALAPAGR